MSAEVSVSDRNTTSVSTAPIISLKTMVPLPRRKARRETRRLVNPYEPITHKEMTSFAITHAYTQDVGDIAIKPENHVWKREPNRIEHDESASLGRTLEKKAFSSTFVTTLPTNMTTSGHLPATEATTVKLTNAYRLPVGVPETVSSTSNRHTLPPLHQPWLPPPPSLIPLPLPPQLTSYLTDGPVRTRRGGGYGSVREHQLYAGASSGALAAAIVGKSSQNPPQFDNSGNIKQNPDTHTSTDFGVSAGKPMGTRYAIQALGDPSATHARADAQSPERSHSHCATATSDDIPATTLITAMPVTSSSFARPLTTPSTVATTPAATARLPSSPALPPKPFLGALQLPPPSAPYHPLQPLRMAAGTLVTRARRRKVDVAALRVAQDEQELRRVSLALTAATHSTHSTHTATANPRIRHSDTHAHMAASSAAAVSPSRRGSRSRSPRRADFTHVGRVPVAGVASHYALCSLDALACVERGVDARVRSGPGAHSASDPHVLSRPSPSLAEVLSQSPPPDMPVVDDETASPARTRTLQRTGSVPRGLHASGSVAGLQRTTSMAGLLRASSIAALTGSLQGVHSIDSIVGDGGDADASAGAGVGVGASAGPASLDSEGDNSGVQELESAHGDTIHHRSSLPPARSRIRLLAWLTARPLKPPYRHAYAADATGRSMLLPPAWAGVNRGLIAVDARGLAALYPMLALEQLGPDSERSCSGASRERATTGVGCVVEEWTGDIRPPREHAPPCVLTDADLCNLLQLVPDCCMLLRALQILQGAGVRVYSATELLEMVCAVLSEVAAHVQPTHTLIHQQALLPPAVLTVVQPKTCFQLLLHCPAPPALVPSILRIIASTRGRFAVLPQLAHAVSGCYHLLQQNGGVGAHGGAAALHWGFLRRQRRGEDALHSDRPEHGNGYASDDEGDQRLEEGVHGEGYVGAGEMRSMHRTPSSTATARDLGHSLASFGYDSRPTSPLHPHGYAPAPAQTQAPSVSAAAVDALGSTEQHVVFAWLREWRKPLLALIRHERARRLQVHQRTSTFDAQAVSADAFRGLSLSLAELNALVAAARVGDEDAADVYVRSYDHPSHCTDTATEAGDVSADTPTLLSASASVSGSASASESAPMSKVWRYRTYPCEHNFFSVLAAPASADASSASSHWLDDSAATVTVRVTSATPAGTAAVKPRATDVADAAAHVGSHQSSAASAPPLYLTDHAIHGLLPLQRHVLTTGVLPAYSHVSAGSVQLRHVLHTLIVSGPLSATAMEELTPLLPHGADLPLSGPAILADLVAVTAICLRRASQALLSYFNAQHTRAELLAHERGAAESPRAGHFDDHSSCSQPLPRDDAPHVSLSRAATTLSRAPSPAAAPAHDGAHAALPPLTAAHAHHALQHLGAGVYGPVVVADYLDLCARMVSLRAVGGQEHSTSSDYAATGPTARDGAVRRGSVKRTLTKEGVSVAGSSGALFPRSSSPTASNLAFRSPLLPSLSLGTLTTQDEQGQPLSLLLGQREREMFHARIFPGVCYEIPPDAGFAFIVVNAARHYKALRAAYLRDGCGVYASLGYARGAELLPTSEHPASAAAGLSTATRGDEFGRDSTISRSSFHSISQACAPSLPPVLRADSVSTGTAKPLPKPLGGAFVSPVPTSPAHVHSSASLSSRHSAGSLGPQHGLHAQSRGNSAASMLSPHQHPRTQAHQRTESRVGSGMVADHGAPHRPRLDTTPLAVLSSALPLVHVELFHVLAKNTLVASIAKRSVPSSAAKASDTGAHSHERNHRHGHTGSGASHASLPGAGTSPGLHAARPKSPVRPFSPSQTLSLLTPASPADSFTGKGKARKQPALPAPLADFSMSLLQLDRLLWAGLLSVHHTVIALGYAEQLSLQIHSLDELLEVLRQTQWAIDLVALHKDTKLRERLLQVERVRRIQQLYGTKHLAASEGEDEDEDDEDEEPANESQHALHSPYSSTAATHAAIPVLPIEIPRHTTLLSISAPPSPLTPIRALRASEEELALPPTLDALMRNHDVEDANYKSPSLLSSAPTKRAPAPPAPPAPAPLAPQTPLQHAPSTPSVAAIPASSSRDAAGVGARVSTPSVPDAITPLSVLRSDSFFAHSATETLPVPTSLLPTPPSPVNAATLVLPRIASARAEDANSTPANAAPTGNVGSSKPAIPAPQSAPPLAPPAPSAAPPKPPQRRAPAPIMAPVDNS